MPLILFGSMTLFILSPLVRQPWARKRGEGQPGTPDGMHAVNIGGLACTWRHCSAQPKIEPSASC
jgi:hypothetical protein